MLLQDSASLAACLVDSNIQIILWVGGDWPTDAENDEVKDWVSSGGALVHGFDETKWQKQG